MYPLSRYYHFFSTYPFHNTREQIERCSFVNPTLGISLLLSALHRSCGQESSQLDISKLSHHNNLYSFAQYVSSASPRGLLPYCLRFVCSVHFLGLCGTLMYLADVAPYRFEHRASVHIPRTDQAHLHLQELPGHSAFGSHIWRLEPSLERLMGLYCISD
jgi:hypothetical protein